MMLDGSILVMWTYNIISICITDYNCIMIFIYNIIWYIQIMQDMIICKSNKSRSWWVDLHPQLTSTAHGPRYLWLMDSNAYVLEGTGWTLGAGLMIVYHFIISYIRKVYKESIYRWVDLQTSVLGKGGYHLKMLCKGVWEMWKQLCTVTRQQDRKRPWDSTSSTILRWPRPGTQTVLKGTWNSAKAIRNSMTWRFDADLISALQVLWPLLGDVQRRGCRHSSAGPMDHDGWWWSKKVTAEVASNWRGISIDQSIHLSNLSNLLIF